VDLIVDLGPLFFAVVLLLRTDEMAVGVHIPIANPNLPPVGTEPGFVLYASIRADRGPSMETLRAKHGHAASRHHSALSPSLLTENQHRQGRSSTYQEHFGAETVFHGSHTLLCLSVRVKNPNPPGVWTWFGIGSRKRARHATFTRVLPTSWTMRPRPHPSEPSCQTSQNHHLEIVL
jgi:hypothetical protein